MELVFLGSHRLPRYATLWLFLVKSGSKWSKKDNLSSRSLYGIALQRCNLR